VPPIPPQKFYAQDLNSDPATNGTLSAFTEANNERAEFLENFVASELESFESYETQDSLQIFQATAITSVGAVTFRGLLEVLRGTESLGGFRFPTEGTQWLWVALGASGLEIVFPTTVVGAGFVIVDLDDASNGPMPITVQFFNEEDQVDTIELTPGNRGNVVFIGYINPLGFTRIVLPIFSDQIAIDMLNAYVASELA
jgi:hypothetical protein